MNRSRTIRRFYGELLKRDEWRQYADRIIESRGYCWQCGSAGDLLAHHLNYRDGFLPWEYHDDEIRVLCKECHGLIHIISDEIWIETLSFDSHGLERLLKQIREIKESELNLRMATDSPYDYRITR